MKKFKKMIVLVCVLVVLSAFTTTTYAQPWFGDDFVYIGKTTVLDEDWYKLLINPNGAPLVSHKTVSRELSASCTTSIEIAVDGLTAHVTGGLEIAIGSTRREEWSTDFTALAWTDVRCSAGSVVEKPWGHKNYYLFGVCTSSYIVSMAASTGDYDKQVLVKTYPH